MSTPASQPSARGLLVGILLSLPFLLMGGFLAGIGLHWIPYDPAKIHAPGWIIVICGSMFVAGGVAMLRTTTGRGASSQPFLGVAILICLTIVAHWVAFGAGERHFTRTTSINDVEFASGPVDEHAGRIVFGAGAVILDLVLAAVVIARLRKRAQRSRVAR